MVRQIIVGVLVLHLLSAVFLFYPAWRVSHWMGLGEGVALTLALVLFFSQALVRIALRRIRQDALGRLVRSITAGADFFLGIAPVMLLTTLAADLYLNFGVRALGVGAPGVGGDGVGALGVGGDGVGALFLEPHGVGGLVLCVWLIAGLWGTFKAWWPDVVTVPLVSKKLTQDIRFVQISDVHIGSRTTRFLNQVVRRVNLLAPDFLCITGDFIDQRGIDEEQLAPLAELTMPVYFCTGNHEHYEDLEEILERLQRLGVEVLRGRSVQRHGIQVVGFDDHSNPHFLREALPTLKLDRSLFTLLLFHRPHGLEHAAANGVDLKISGHTHNGQIKPFNWLVRAQFKYIKGLYNHGDTHLYVNEGTGTWGPTLRLGTRSEITLFELSAEKALTG